MKVLANSLWRHCDEKAESLTGEGVVQPPLSKVTGGRREEKKRNIKRKRENDDDAWLHSSRNSNNAREGRNDLR